MSNSTGYLYRKTNNGFEPVAIEFESLTPGIYYVKKDTNRKSIYCLTYFFDNNITSETDLKEKILTIDVAEVITENFESTILKSNNSSIFERSIALAKKIVEKLVNSLESNSYYSWEEFLEKNNIKYFEFKFDSNYTLKINCNIQQLELSGPEINAIITLADNKNISTEHVFEIIKNFLTNLILLVSTKKEKE